MCGPLADTQAIIEGLGITLSKMTSPPPPSMPFPQPGPGEGGMPGLPPPPPLGLGPDTAVPAGGEPAAATSGSSGGGWFSWLTGSGEETKASAAGRVDVASARAPNSFEHALVTLLMLVLLVRKPTECAALPLSSSSRCRSQRSLPLKCTRFMTRALCLHRLRLTMPSTTSSSNSTNRSVTTRRGRQQQQSKATCHLAPVWCHIVIKKGRRRAPTPCVGVIICSHQCANIEASAAAEAIHMKAFSSKKMQKCSLRPGSNQRPRDSHAMAWLPELQSHALPTELQRVRVDS